ncbi:hypothetical protein HGK51_07040 [Helicobacter pylori]|uniref:Periplasmic protein n=1 Tax=Helicobacter pylori TaxID=210 RepID=A0ABD7CDS9_HELPX|nr:hypothetical protein [Helicobacter pylori]QQX00049.1 hypothetical protein HGK51_07040 [Helicobacter pylori]
MKRLAIALALVLGVAWGKTLPKWARNCSKEVQIEKAQTKDEKILVCGMSDVLLSDMDYSLSSARQNALEKVMEAFKEDKIEIKASELKAIFVDTDKVYVLLKITKKHIALMNE